MCICGCTVGLITMNHARNLTQSTYSVHQESQLKAARVQIYVRRGGPNYQKGLAKMRELGAEIGIPIEVRHNDLGFRTCLALCFSHFLNTRILFLVHRTMRYNEEQTGLMKCTPRPREPIFFLSSWPGAGIWTRSKYDWNLQASNRLHQHRRIDKNVGVFNCHSFFTATWAYNSIVYYTSSVALMYAHRMAGIA